MDEKEELQKKVLAYRILEARLNGLVEQRKILIDKIEEIRAAEGSIDEIKTDVPILVPLGGEAHAIGKITDSSKIIIEIGAGVALEKTLEEGKELLKGRIEELKNALAGVENEIAETSASLERLGPEIEKLVKKE